MKLIRLASNRLKKASTRRTLAGAFGLLLALGLTVGLVLPALAESMPPIPHSFKGSVTMNGSQAPVGTPVYAEVRGTTVHAYTTIDNNGTYGYSPAFFLESPDNSYLGKPVDFFVAGIPAGTYPQLEWGGETVFDLAVNAQLYTLTVTSDNCCPVQVGSLGTVPVHTTQQFSVAGGSQVQLQALADNCCCQFSSWTINGAAQQGNPYTVTISGNTTAVAHCTALGPYILTVTANAFCSVNAGALGTVAAGQTCNFTVPCGTEVQLQATAGQSCSLPSSVWTLDGVAQTGNPITFTMCSNRTASACGVNQQATTYDLTVTAAACCPINIPGVGTVAANTTQEFAVPAGTQVQLTPQCTPCCTFNNWTVDGATQTGATLNLTMSADHTAVANCTALGPYSLTVTSDNCCTVTVYDKGTVQPGQTQTFSQIPCGTQIQITLSGPECCQFCYWTVDGGAQVTDNPLNVTMNSNHNVLAHCVTSGNFTLITVPSPSTGGTVTGAGSYPCGTDVTVQAIPNPGWTFTGWSGVTSSNGTTAIVHMNGNKTVTATFAPPGSILDIPLPAGWCTFSVPIALDASTDTWAELKSVSSLSIDLAYYFDPSTGQFVSVDNNAVIKPLDGFFLKMHTAGTARIIPSTELTSPPSKQLLVGANLVGVASLVDLSAAQDLMSVYNVAGNLTGYAQALNPPYNTPNDWDGNLYVRDDPDSPTMKVGKAYWVVMVNSGKIFGFTTTPQP